MIQAQTANFDNTLRFFDAYFNNEAETAQRETRMRRLILFLLFLIASVSFGLVVVRHPGYLLVVYQPWMVQMPLWFAILGLFYHFLIILFCCHQH